MFYIQQGDALSLISSIESDSVDAVISDPPYSSGGIFSRDRALTTGEKYSTTNKFPDFHGDNKDQRSYSFWLNLVLTECYRVVNPSSPIALFTDWRQLPLMSDILQSAGFVWRGIYVWDKTAAARPRKGYFRQQAEFVVWGTKGAAQKRSEWPALLGLKTCSVNKGGRFHQTGKPLELMREIIKICEPNGQILDPFMGSGSTGVAAVEDGKSFIGFEYTKHYFNVARERLKEAFNGCAHNTDAQPLRTQ